MRSNAHMPAEWRPVGDVLALIGDKWTVMVIGDLDGGKKRFSELRRDLPGISQKMLSTKLRALERDGLVERTFYPVIPPRVEYELTPLGRELLSSLESLTEFALMHQFQVEESRRRFDAAGHGEAMHVALPGRRAAP
jgi:DNA-binding HxlR family transcriptional regulator